MISHLFHIYITYGTYGYGSTTLGYRYYCYISFSLSLYSCFGFIVTMCGRGVCGYGSGNIFHIVGPQGLVQMATNFYNYNYNHIDEGYISKPF